MFLSAKQREHHMGLGRAQIDLRTFSDLQRTLSDFRHEGHQGHKEHDALFPRGERAVFGWQEMGDSLGDVLKLDLRRWSGNPLSAADNAEGCRTSAQRS